MKLKCSGCRGHKLRIEFERGQSMTRNLEKLSLLSEYSSSGADLVRDFFIPSLENSSTYNRAAGYFSSSLFILAPAAWTDFFLDGGTMKLLCSAELSKNDAARLTNAFDEQQWAQDTFEAAWRKLTSNSSKDLTSSLLRTLIHFGKLELRVAIYRDRAGLFHDKLGVFQDEENNSVSFTGSANETWNAWSGLGNHESIDVFKSWDENDENRVSSHKTRFEQYWAGQRPDLLVFGGQSLKDVVLEKKPDEDLETVLSRVRKEMSEALGLRKPTPAPNKPVKSLRPYQSEAISNWVENGYEGVLSFATGGGKTLTAIEGIRRWSQLGGSTLVLVPTEILVSQWLKEIETELPSSQVLRADSTSTAPWKKLINAFLAGGDSNRPRITITTYATAAGRTFSNLARGGPKLLVIGDEVHRFGAKSTRTIADRLQKGASLGLSATPFRGYDEEGTDAIFGYFGDPIQPVYSLKEAIRDGNLVPYRFKYMTAKLSSEEQQQWDELTRKIFKATSGSSEQPNSFSTDRLTTLLATRARIAKTAESKIAMMGKLIHDEFEDGDRWLVYCETEAHIDRVVEEIRRVNPDLTLMRYTTSNENEHERVLAHFRGVGGVLVAIRCLDEGVDIPVINKAVIVSSSQSQREFIQRRGRALRRAEGKHLAHLHDFLMENDQGDVLAMPEFERLIEFSQDALNQGPYLELIQRRDSISTHGGLSDG